MSATVTVCRDCCCGTTRKHPEVDHDGQLALLREGIADAGRVVVSDCRLACERSNVIVVSGPDARPVWLRDVLTPELTSAVVEWVRAGGPGRASVPQALAAHITLRPSR